MTIAGILKRLRNKCISHPGLRRRLAPQEETQECCEKCRQPFDLLQVRIVNGQFLCDNCIQRYANPDPRN